MSSFPSESDLICGSCGSPTFCVDDVSICSKCWKLRHGESGKSKTNSSRHINTYTLDRTISNSMRVSYQVSACILFYVVYFHLRNESLQPLPVLHCCWTSTVVGYCVYVVFISYPFKPSLQFLRLLIGFEEIKITLVYVTFLHFLAPVFKTLTETISCDTIHACSVMFTILHLATNDYGISGFMVSKTVSINAAILAVLFLTSQLPSVYHSVALLATGVVVFLLFPVFSTMLWTSRLTLVLLIVIVAYACFTVSSNSLLYFSLAVFSTGTVFPTLYYILQTQKLRFSGPWDEATPLQT